MLAYQKQKLQLKRIKSSKIMQNEIHAHTRGYVHTSHRIGLAHSNINTELMEKIDRIE